MRLISLFSIDSTNSHALRLIREGLTEDILIYSEEQTKGRGQRGNNWLSRPGDGIYCSYVFFHKHLSIDKQYVFNMCMSVAIAQYVSSKINQSVKIKWPNDILVNNKKIAGLLIENTIKGEQIGVSIVGIGLNLNQLWQNPAFDTAGTSLRMITGSEYNYEQEVFELARFVKKAKEDFEKGDYENVVKQYHEYLYGYNQLITFQMEEQEVNAILKGINHDGSAIILKDGHQQNVMHPQARIVVKHS